MPTEFAQQAQDLLRDTDHFQWYVISLLAIVTYIYSVEVHNKSYNAVFAGLAFWGADSINEILNSVFFHLNGYAPLWATPGDTAYLVLIGLNIEIMFMFAIAGVAWSKMLLPDPSSKILGLPNRWFIAVTGSVCLSWAISVSFLPTYSGCGSNCVNQNPSGGAISLSANSYSLLAFRSLEGISTIMFACQ